MGTKMKRAKERLQSSMCSIACGSPWPVCCNREVTTRLRQLQVRLWFLDWIFFIIALHFAMLCHAMPCYAMLCYAMLCYAMPCYAMLCHAMPCRSMRCWAVLCCAVLCCAMLCCAVLCYAMLCYAMLCYAMLCYAMLCCAVMWCDVLCCAVLCYGMLCCVGLCCATVYAMLCYVTCAQFKVRTWQYYRQIYICRFSSVRSPVNRLLLVLRAGAGVHLHSKPRRVPRV